MLQRDISLIPTEKSSPMLQQRRKKVTQFQDIYSLTAQNKMLTDGIILMLLQELSIPIYMNITTRWIALFPSHPTSNRYRR